MDSHIVYLQSAQKCLQIYRVNHAETTGGRLHATTPTSGVIGCLATLYAGVFTDHIHLYYANAYLTQCIASCLSSDRDRHYALCATVGFQQQRTMAIYFV